MKYLDKLLVTTNCYIYISIPKVLPITGFAIVKPILGYIIKYNIIYIIKLNSVYIIYNYKIFIELLCVLTYKYTVHNNVY